MDPITSLVNNINFPNLINISAIKNNLENYYSLMYGCKSENALNYN